MAEPSKSDMSNCGPDCGPDNQHENQSDCGPECGPECADGHCAPAEPNAARDSTLTKTVDSLVLMMFVVGVYAQIFSFLLFAFS